MSDEIEWLDSDDPQREVALARLRLHQAEVSVRLQAAKAAGGPVPNELALELQAVRRVARLAAHPDATIGLQGEQVHVLSPGRPDGDGVVNADPIAAAATAPSVTMEVVSEDG